jgi:hypothetical protein
MTELFGNTGDFDAQNMWKILVICIILIVFIIGITPPNRLTDAVISISIMIVLCAVLIFYFDSQKHKKI